MRRRGIVRARVCATLVGFASLVVLFNNAGAQPLAEIERHVDNVVARHAGFLPTRGTITSRSFTANRCSPEQGGYFGATYGSPSLITYGFELETTPSADINSIIERIKSTVISKVLISTFPEVCNPSSTEQWNIGQIWGFQFMNEVPLSSDPCSGIQLQSNTCGSYESSLAIFGSGTVESRQKILSVIQSALSSNEIKFMDSSIVMIIPMSIQREKISVHAAASSVPSSSTSSGMAPGGIALAVMAAVFGTAAIAAFQWRRYNAKLRDADAAQEKTVCDDSHQNYDDVTQFIYRASTDMSDRSDQDECSRGLDEQQPHDHQQPHRQWGLGNIEFDIAGKPAALNRWKWIV